jgi:hypothetical protein
MVKIEKLKIIKSFETKVENVLFFAKMNDGWFPMYKCGVVPPGVLPGKTDHVRNSIKICGYSVRQYPGQ